MTREEKRNWLRNATPDQLMLHYSSIKSQQARIERNDADWITLSDDITLTELEILNRLEKLNVIEMYTKEEIKFLDERLERQQTRLEDAISRGDIRNAENRRRIMDRFDAEKDALRYVRGIIENKKDDMEG